MYKVGDFIRVVSINPNDLPNERLERFIGDIGQIIEVFYSANNESEVLSIRLEFVDKERDDFWPSVDELELVESRKPDWEI